jgi:CubicO group peptidase (beta-lactamase class C family)
MYSPAFVLTLLTLSSLSFTSLAQSVQPCPLLGPVFPAPSNPSRSSAIRAATKSATDAIQAALLNATIYGQLDPNTTSFSIDVYSAHEKSSIFTYHYSAPALAHPTEGVAKVDSNTVYRIGSVSKLLTVYTYLAAAGDVSFNEPVTKYIPELAAYAKKNAAALKTSDIDVFDWNDVTVGALASHMAGIVRDFAPNLASEASLVQLLGPVPDVNVKFCGNLAQGQLPCNRSGKSNPCDPLLHTTCLVACARTSCAQPCLCARADIVQCSPYSSPGLFREQGGRCGVLHLSHPAISCTGPIYQVSADSFSGFFSDIALEHPVVAPFSTPIYSNAAFQILSYVLEAITSNPFSTSFNNQLIRPLNLNATTYSLPSTNPSSSVIPINATASWYNADILDETPAGGYYSSINDLRRIGISILSSTLLTPAQTRRWMKPLTFTSDANFSVGAPWEIVRAPNLNRTSYLYTKSGDIGLYSAELALLPDYDVGFTVLAAGLQTDANVRIISDILAAVFVPALEAAAKQEADQVYAGTYTGPAGTNSSLTVVTDGSPGLGVTRWMENGTDVLPLIGIILGATPDQLAQLAAVGGGVSIRLYPTGLMSSDGTKAAWRAVYEVLPEPSDPGAFSQNCVTWVTVDSVIYGAVGADEFLFNLSTGGGSAVSIEPRVLRTELQRAGAGGGKKKRMAREWRG